MYKLLLKDYYDTLIKIVDKYTSNYKSFKFSGTQELFYVEVQKYVVKSKDLVFNKTEQNKFEINMTSIAGEMYVNDKPLNEKDIFGFIEIINDDNIKVTLKSRPRKSILILLLIGFFCIFLMIMSKEKFPFYVYLLPFIPLFWFNWLYKIQQQDLIDRITKHFNKLAKYKKRIN